MEVQKNKHGWPIPDPGKCLVCMKGFHVQENGYYCSGCGYMGWFTLDQWYDARDYYLDAGGKL